MTDDLKARLRGLELKVLPGISNLTNEAADRIEVLEVALKQQSENMVFVLNHATLPDQWYCRFSNELDEARAALAGGGDE